MQEDIARLKICPSEEMLLFSNCQSVFLSEISQIKLIFNYYLVFHQKSISSKIS